MSHPLAEKLRPHVQAIKSAAEAGDTQAQQVITLYEMCRRVPSDQAAFVLCEETFDRWFASRSTQERASLDQVNILSPSTPSAPALFTPSEDSMR